MAIEGKKMIEEDQPKFAEFMTLLSQSYNQEIVEARMNIYFKVLAADYSIEQLHKALPKILKECKFFPSIAEICEATDHECYRNLDGQPMQKWAIEAARRRAMSDQAQVEPGRPRFKLTRGSDL
jgi:hypothetical protein